MGPRFPELMESLSRVAPAVTADMPALQQSATSCRERLQHFTYLRSQ